VILIKEKRDKQLIIRAAEPNDAKLLVNLIEQVESSGFMLFEPGERKISEEQMKKRIDSIKAEKYSTILLAENNGDLVGYLFAVGGNPMRTKHSVYVAIGVAENERGKGIGGRLFEALEEWANQRSIHRLELTVITNNTAGIALYKKTGFEIEGTKRDSLLIGGKYVDEYYMSKLL
jgi:RimJ/RimL family protein N-acetyltransferase